MHRRKEHFVDYLSVSIDGEFNFNLSNCSAGSTFLFDHVPGGDYQLGHNVLVTDGFQVTNGTLEFSFSAVVDPNDSDNNSDPSLAGYAAIRME